jgi:hypothetical protein
VSWPKLDSKQQRQILLLTNYVNSACFVAGAAGHWADEQEKGGVLAAEDWELSQMCNSQFTIGGWENSKSVGVAV